MILADTSIWAEHLRGDDLLVARLDAGEIAVHAYVIAEVALGSLKNRSRTLGDFALLPRVPVADTDEVMDLIEVRRLFSRGIGFVDTHLLASCLIDGKLRLWTRDRKLNRVATELGIAYWPEQ